MSSLLEEEENYVRMSLLLTGLSPRAVRALFDKAFPPTSLPSTLNQKYNTLLSLQKSRVLNQAQWNHLFPPRQGVADSKAFDATLMICLIRNLTSIAPPAFGFDHLPSTVETTPGSDIARIKYYRNYLAHLDDNKINNSDFTTAWKDISEAVGRLGGSSLLLESQALKTKILDQSNREIMLEVQNLKLFHGCLQDDVETKHAQTSEEIKELKSEHQQCIQEIDMLKDTVPRNIRDQITKELTNWKEEDQMFVDTCAASHVLQCTKTNSCVTVTGSYGVGKTFTIRHVALQMADDGYDILPVTDPKDIVKYHNPNKKTLYVVEDLCGTYTLNHTYMDIWKTLHEDITGLLKNDGTKIIASCRLQVYQDVQFKLLPLFKVCACNFLSQNMSLSTEEKQLIAERYLKSDSSKISQCIDLFDFFPLLCRLYHENQTSNVEDFFQNPFSVYEEEIDKLNIEKAYGKYCALALCVMFNNHLKEEWLTDDFNHDIKRVIKNTCEACRLNRTTPRLVLQDELDSLIHTFLKKEKGCYRTIHDTLFDFLFLYFAKSSMITCIIKNGDSRLISERLVLKGKDGSDQFTAIVPDKYHQMYIERMFDDWSKGEVVKVFTNINMKSPEFRNTLFTYLKKLCKTIQKQLAGMCDDTVEVLFEDCHANYYNRSIPVYYSRMNTPLLYSCSIGDICMVRWCCSNGADVNCCNNYNESPLFVACEGGYTDIVTYLVDKKADINKYTLYIESPLYIASKGGYTDIVSKLVDNKADINKCTEYGESPLYIACKRGYIEIVNKLLDHKADIDNCRMDLLLCLYIGLVRGTPDELDLIMNIGDISQGTKYGESPLYVACEGGYTDIVSKLVDSKADINKDTKWSGESPLFIACKKGFIQIVDILIANGGDYTKCDNAGQSPLDIARHTGHDNIVECLTRYSLVQ